MARRISVFGATGSIGQSTIDLIKNDPEAFNIVALSAGRNVKLLARDARALAADVAVISDPALLPELEHALAGSGVEAVAGRAALLEAASRPADWVMSAIVGLAGLEPGLAALGAGATLALANKESLVAAGPLLMAEATRRGLDVLPVDSEHSAIFQALNGEDRRAVDRVIITASGGAFRDWPLADLAAATPKQASSHPNWDMGQRITIDSASMFNKAMEVIETKEYFGFQPKQIEVLIHPQSLVHAMVGFRDGGVMAHLGPADMRHAIGYALYFPDRADLGLEALDFTRIGTLDFLAPCEIRYPALRLAREVMQAGGMSGAAFTAAKDCALDGFLAGKIGFTEMADVVAETLDILGGDLHIPGSATKSGHMTLELVRETDHLSQKTAGAVIASRQN